MQQFKVTLSMDLEWDNNERDWEPEEVEEAIREALDNAMDEDFTWNDEDMEIEVELQEGGEELGIEELK